VFFLGASHASGMDQSYDDAWGLGSGFVAIEGGWWRFFGKARDTVNDPWMGYITTGFSLTKAFSSVLDDYEPLKIGPKIGIGIGNPKKPGASYELFYDLLVKIRYTFGSENSRIRPFVDAGPGFVNYEDAAFELEGGAGIDYYAGTGSVGINVQYKELFGAGVLKRGVVFLGSLAYHF